MVSFSIAFLRSESNCNFFLFSLDSLIMLYVYKNGLRIELRGKANTAAATLISGEIRIPLYANNANKHTGNQQRKLDTAIDISRRAIFLSCDARDMFADDMELFITDR